MSVDIPNVDADHLAEWAFAQMYRAMRDAEQSSDDYNYNSKLVENSKSGDRLIPRPSDLDILSGKVKFFMQRAEMYASIFAACELADDSPHRDKYRRAIQAVDRQRAGKTIPQQRTP